MMSDPNVHSENLTSVAIDGARINVFTTTAIVAADPDIPLERKAAMLQALEAAAMLLDRVRDGLPAEAASVHIVRPGDL